MAFEIIKRTYLLTILCKGFKLNRALPLGATLPLQALPSDPGDYSNNVQY